MSGQELGKRVMRKADIYLDIHRKRGLNRLPLERVYKHLFDPELWLRAYGRIYRNAGAMTRGTTKETVDGMNLQKIHKAIALLKMEQYEWTPVRRTEIPKANGKTRPLGIPTWSDKLLQEVLRSLLEPYYEPMFNSHSHGFRPERSCHSALREIRSEWTGTTWFIEGDIKGCFDNIDHDVLLSIIRRNIRDDRLLRLLKGLIEAGYVEDWRWHENTAGTPQGGIISPLLSNIYLNELDQFFEDTLRPQYTQGKKRRDNPEWAHILRQKRAAWEAGDRELWKQLRSKQRELPSFDPCEPGYRRLRYVRYADDFLLGFVGPASEAREIRDRIGGFLRDHLKLTLSAEKTLITHAGDDKARFLGYEIEVMRLGDQIARDGRRAKNGRISFLMPQSVVSKYRARYSKNGKVIHRAELLDETDYTIIQRYQGVLLGLHNYYCMAYNVSKRMGNIKRILLASLLKTLASKLGRSMRTIIRMYHVPNQEYQVFRKIIERPGKDPLVAIFGGFSLGRKPEGMGKDGFNIHEAWHRPASYKTEAVQALIYGECCLCGAKGVEMHHLRKLADIDRPGRRPKQLWERIMAARRRKSIPVCKDCHDDIHAGRYDGPRLRRALLESRMR
jgi:group II intron reverse transcriptase/maturase